MVYHLCAAKFKGSTCTCTVRVLVHSVSGDKEELNAIDLLGGGVQLKCHQSFHLNVQ